MFEEFLGEVFALLGMKYRFDRIFASATQSYLDGESLADDMITDSIFR